MFWGMMVYIVLWVLTVIVCVVHAYHHPEMKTRGGPIGDQGVIGRLFINIIAGFVWPIIWMFLAFEFLTWNDIRRWVMKRQGKKEM